MKICASGTFSTVQYGKFTIVGDIFERTEERILKILTIVGEFSKEALAIRVGRS